ncbi:MAG: zinc dependent phospholipase C family protein [Candidatus Acidiferrales bacterium]
MNVRVQVASGKLFALPSILLLLTLLAPGARAYSVLSHEAVIDSAWQPSIQPLLLARFPNATPEQLREARGYAYGGAIIQDLGYYPHDSHLFSDLVHYVRSGDFVVALLRDSSTLDEYAFALGALAHYTADTNGHAIGVNRAVPVLYPRLRKKYGDIVTYEENPSAHLKTEFGFDVLEVAKGRYASDAYHDMIGFSVAEPLLERAFQETYSLPMQSFFPDLDRSVNSYRFDVRTILPKATRVAWVLKKNEIQSSLPGTTRRTFLYNLPRVRYEREWGRNYRHPGTGDKFLAFLIRIVPKIGPLRALSFVTPTPQTEAMFMESFNSTLDTYRVFIAQIRSGQLELPNTNLDTGSADPPGAYFMADNAYARLVDMLAQRHFQSVSPELRADILAYYSDPNAPIATRKKPREWARLTDELRQLKSIPTEGSAAPSPTTVPPATGPASNRSPGP